MFNVFWLPAFSLPLAGYPQNEDKLPPTAAAAAVRLWLRARPDHKHHHNKHQNHLH